MFEQSLIQVGLSYPQSIIYEALLKNGPLPASKIAQKTSFKRGLIYKTLEDLVKAELVKKDEKPGKVAIFEAKHPTSLRSFAEKKEQRAKDAKLALEGVLPSIISDFNLVSGQPGVLFYEGEEGMRIILEDTLKSKTDVYLFLNSTALQEEKKFIAINEKYKRKRELAGVKKKIIRVGERPMTEKVNKKYGAITEVKYLNKESCPFKASVQIYDNKISFQIIDKGQIISILIDNRNMYEMHKAWFEFMWESIRED